MHLNLCKLTRRSCWAQNSQAFFLCRRHKYPISSFLILMRMQEVISTGSPDIYTHNASENKWWEDVFALLSPALSVLAMHLMSHFSSIESLALLLLGIYSLFFFFFWIFECSGSFNHLHFFQISFPPGSSPENQREKDKEGGRFGEVGGRGARGGGVWNEFKWFLGEIPPGISGSSLGSVMCHQRRFRCWYYVHCAAHTGNLQVLWHITVIFIILHPVLQMQGNSN